MTQRVLFKIKIFINLKIYINYSLFSCITIIHYYIIFVIIYIIKNQLNR